MKQKQTIEPALQVIEVFMPILEHEQFLVDEVLTKVEDIPFYKGIELGVLFDRTQRKRVRTMVEKNKWQLTTWLSPSILDFGYNLSAIDPDERKRSVERAILLSEMAAEAGSTHLGLPCGPYMGEEYHDKALGALKASFEELLAWIEKTGAPVDYTFEPLDRYAHKKQLLGPMKETVAFVSELRKISDKIFIHWDSAHETLANIDLSESLELAQPYLAQIHICNCVNDPEHPYYGDWHMDVGQPPTYKNWGYLNAEIAADMLRKVVSFERAPGIDRTFCAVEVRCHKGNDMWQTESLVRSFLQKAYDLAGLEYDK